MKQMLSSYTPLIFSLLLLFCKSPEKGNNIAESSKTTPSKTIVKHPKFNDYWYAGKAEITSYKLSQVRYGENHQGTAVNIYVTEDFLPKKQVKADYQNDTNIPILKLNSTKNFTTGIYPYSLMNSTFSPIVAGKDAIKISFSSQEWCGNTFVQLNNKANYQIAFHSYFESNSDRKITLKKYPLENHFWNVLRINPKSIKNGKYQVIPSIEFLALNHKKFKAYDAEVNLVEDNEYLKFSISYPDLQRKLNINLSKDFPHIIESWEETMTSRGKTLTTTATKIKTIKSAYWSKNGVDDIAERKELGLD